MYGRIFLKGDDMKKIKWGIMATGNIAEKLAEAINFSKGSELYAVASRSVDKANSFAAKYKAVKYYGSYEELAEDSDIDVIYIATPMAQHYENAAMCIRNSRNVLCEKTITLDCKQFDELIKIAEENNVFFMEAMWMKFIPSFRLAKEWVESGKIGTVKAVRADLSSLCPYNPDNRFYAKSLGGGSLLDLGVYPLTFACEFLSYKPDEIITNAYIGESGVDYDASLLLRYKNGSFADSQIGFDFLKENKACIIGDKGSITFGNWFFCTTELTLRDKYGNVVETPQLSHQCNGYEYEVKEVEECLSEHRKQSLVNPLSNTRAILEIMDCCRAQWGLDFNK